MYYSDFVYTALSKEYRSVSPLCRTDIASQEVEGRVFASGFELLFNIFNRKIIIYFFGIDGVSLRLCGDKKRQFRPCAEDERD